MTRLDTTHRLPLVYAVVLAFTLVAGCSSSESSSTAPDSPSRTAPSSSTDPATAGPLSPSISPSSSPDPVAAEVGAVYRAYWAARVKAQAAPDKLVPVELETFAIDKARTDVKSSLLLFRQQGVAFRGQPVLSPVVTVSGSGVRARASIADCVDSSQWTPVFVATGASALAPGQPTRVVVESTARRYAGRWAIDTSIAHRDRPC